MILFYRQIKVIPIGIIRFNQLIFLFPFPGFDLFFPLEGGFDIGSYFVMDQLMHLIAGSKTVRIQIVPVFVHPAFQVIRYARIDRYIRLVGQNIDIIGHPRSPFL